MALSAQQPLRQAFPAAAAARGQTSTSSVQLLLRHHSRQQTTHFSTTAPGQLAAAGACTPPPAADQSTRRLVRPLLASAMQRSSSSGSCILSSRTQTPLRRVPAASLEASNCSVRTINVCFRVGPMMKRTAGRRRHLALTHTHAVAGPNVGSDSSPSSESDAPTDGVAVDGGGSGKDAALVVAVVGKDAASPFGNALWLEVMQHMARRVSWIEPKATMLVYTEDQIGGGGGPNSSLPQSSMEAISLEAAVATADVVVGVAIAQPNSVAAVSRLFADKPTAVCFDSDQSLEAQASLGGVRVEELSPIARAAAKFGLWKEGAESIKTLDLVRSCWSRRTADDVWFSVLALVNAFVTDVEELRSLRAAGLEQLQCMVGNCASEIGACLTDETCREGLNCLQSCGPTDQVCSYRCIVSYESPLFEAFSLCVLQKHNCLGLDASIRSRPAVVPMATFRGEPLTHDSAVEIFVGWLGRLQWSWRVVAGQNAAYDQFPCQFQIFFRGKARGSVWYDPVFTVKKLTGESVWRRRHYRVRTRKDPGTFTFSVLDNGVVSEEFWRIVDVPDDLSWGLFYYSGAARAAGQSYTGAVLVTPDGEWPADSQSERLHAALEKCGIKEWELYRVDNSACVDPPLGLPEDSVEPSGVLLEL